MGDIEINVYFLNNRLITNFLIYCYIDNKKGN